MTLEEINKEVEWKERKQSNHPTMEGERWVTDAKRGGVGHGGLVDVESHYCKRETKAEAEAER